MVGRHSPRVDQLHREVTWRVLIVDDSPPVTLTLSKLLTLLGHEAYTADDGEQALEVAARVVPDVIFSDLEMPKLNGLELSRRICQWERDVRPFLVAVSGYGRLEDRRAAANAGFDEFLVKPAMLSDLERVFDALDRVRKVVKR